MKGRIKEAVQTGIVFCAGVCMVTAGILLLFYIRCIYFPAESSTQRMTIEEQIRSERLIF